ncbi:MAG: FAD-dependent oxidoreductase [Pirellulaceae bacterium]
MDLRSGIPFWLINSGLVEVYPPLDGDQRADVTLIGGGISGALLADRLSAAGLEVVVLDKRDIGQGSTCASTSLLQYELDVEMRELAGRVGEEAAARCFRLGLEAIDELQELIAALPSDGLGACGFARRPSLYRASRRSHVKRLQQECELRQRHGFDVAWWDESRLAETRFPAPGAIFSQGDGEVDAYQLTHAALGKARRQGARVYDRTEVTRVETGGERLRLHTPRGIVSCREVVYCTGYESAKYLRRPLGNLQSTYALATEPCGTIAGWPERCLVWETARPYTYLRTTADGRIIIGGYDTPYATDHAQAGRLAAKTRKLRAKLDGWFPDLNLGPAFAWAGVFGESTDGLPYIGSPPEMPHAWFALGYGGNGITFSAIAARLLTDLILGRPNPDARLFGFDR